MRIREAFAFLKCFSTWSCCKQQTRHHQPHNPRNNCSLCMTHNMSNLSTSLSCVTQHHVIYWGFFNYKDRRIRLLQLQHLKIEMNYSILTIYVCKILAAFMGAGIKYLSPNLASPTVASRETNRSRGFPNGNVFFN